MYFRSEGDLLRIMKKILKRKRRVDAVLVMRGKILSGTIFEMGHFKPGCNNTRECTDFDLVVVHKRLRTHVSKNGLPEQVETTGLADPAPVAQSFFVDDAIKRATRLDAIITVSSTNKVYKFCST